MEKQHRTLKDTRKYQTEAARELGEKRSENQIAPEGPNDTK
jgi:hypothetical protein